MVETVVERYGGLHILANNVGITGRVTASSVTEDIWDHSMNVNLKGMVFATKYSIPNMSKTGGGGIPGQ